MKAATSVAKYLIYIYTYIYTQIYIYNEISLTLLTNNPWTRFGAEDFHATNLQLLGKKEWVLEGEPRKSG